MRLSMQSAWHSRDTANAALPGTQARLHVQWVRLIPLPTYVQPGEDIAAVRMQEERGANKKEHQRNQLGRTPTRPDPVPD